MSNRRVILSGGVAKRLLNRGHIVFDVKPKQENPKESCFVFFVDRFLTTDIDDIMANKSNDNSAITRRLQELRMSEQQYKKLIFEEYLKAIEQYSNSTLYLLF